jgi:hypothetical protein
MTRTLDPLAIRRWMLALLLALGCIAAASQARAQMTGNFNTDIVLIETQLSATLAATGRNDAAAARVEMEELYRLWRQFRQKNIDGRPKDPQFAPNMLKAEQRLYAATQLVDQQKLAAARSELDAARILIQGLRPQVPGK